jgi:hypothetical protein
MVRSPAPAGLSPASRRLTAAAAVCSGVLGVLLFVAPGWAAPRFAWHVSELVVMSIGGWFLGNSLWAARIAWDWRWARWSSGLAYLWGFGALQSIVLVAYADKVVTDSALAWLYLGAIALLAVAAVVGVVDVVRLRPSTEDAGPPMPTWLRILTIVFVVFVTFLFAVALLRPSAAVGGGVFPEDLSAFTVRSFGVYFLSLVLGVLVLVRRPTFAPLLAHLEGGLVITAAVLLAAVVHLEVFALTEHPGQWIYLGSYAVVLAIGVPTLVLHGRAVRPDRPGGQARSPMGTQIG